MPNQTINVNRAPVLTLWASVVAQRLGFDYNEALTLGRAVCGASAYAKGKSLGLIEPSLKALADEKKKAAGQTKIDFMGRAISVFLTPEGVRADAKGKPDNPQAVEKYLASKFGDDLAAVTKAMIALAKSVPEDDLRIMAFRLYEKFRPEVPAGVEGWGAMGVLQLDRIAAAASKARR